MKRLFSNSPYLLSPKDGSSNTSTDKHDDSDKYDNPKPDDFRIFNRRQVIGAGLATGAVISSMAITGCSTLATHQ